VPVLRHQCRLKILTTIQAYPTNTFWPIIFGAKIPLIANMVSKAHRYSGCGSCILLSFITHNTFRNYGETWPRSSPSSTRATRNCLFRTSTWLPHVHEAISGSFVDRWSIIAVAFTRIACKFPTWTRHLQVRVFLNHVGVTTMERPRSSLLEQLETWCHSRGANLRPLHRRRVL
jgi:hypothetical protein